MLALQVAKQLLSSGELKTALIAIAQNAGGQVFDQPAVRRKPQASVPGDGAAVALVTLSDQIADPRRRVPHLRRVRRRHDASPSTRHASGGSPAPARAAHRVHRKQDHQGAGPRQPRRCQRWCSPSVTELACNPRILTY